MSEMDWLFGADKVIEDERGTVYRVEVGGTEKLVVCRADGRECWTNLVSIAEELLDQSARLPADEEPQPDNQLTLF